MNYRTFLPWNNHARDSSESQTPDDRSGSVYLDDPMLKLAAETAIVTRRPLLLRGDPGSGKSSFAPFAARNLGWRYYETTITGRTEARDLLWRFDALSRLRDAQAQRPDVSPARYVTPGVLWWTFNATDARAFIDEVTQQAAYNSVARIADNLPVEPFAKLNEERDPHRAVVLIDEIDKADPDVPNDLLEAFGLNRFVVDETGRPVERESPKPSEHPTDPGHFGSLLVIITTNNERELPAAFIRRCVVHRLDEPRDKETLVKRWAEIATLHVSNLIANTKDGTTLVEAVASKCWQFRDEAIKQHRRAPSTAEFLDALRVCLRLGIDPSSDAWKQVERNVVLKGETPSNGQLATE